MKFVTLLSLMFILAAASVFATTDPIPELSQPLVPANAGPGSAAFTLTVHGAGFASGAVVNWNGSPRVTTFKSAVKVTAAILASDIASPGTAIVTVTNPNGTTSNAAYFDITKPTALIGWMAKTAYSAGPYGIGAATADFNGDGKLDLAVVDSAYVGGNIISILLGNGDGTFQAGGTYPAGNYYMAVGDFNNDGKSDLVVTNLPSAGGTGAASILLGNGDGTFQSARSVQVGVHPSLPAVGDFNRDGKLDVAVPNVSDNTISILFGNGDGTVHPQKTYATGRAPYDVVSADFNGDGKLDLATSNDNDGTVSVLIGNGDGTFKAPLAYDAGVGPFALVATDFNADGKLDLGVANASGAVSVLTGNGDGTFQPMTNYQAGITPDSVAFGDFNGDGRMDLAVGNFGSGSVSILLGNGDGTFQTKLDYPAGTYPFQIVSGDFNGDGRLDLVFANDVMTSSLSVLLQSSLALNKTAVAFAAQKVGTASSPKNVVLKNLGSTDVTFTGIIVTGADPSDFTQTNTCPASLAAGASCTVTVVFTPQAKGTRTAAITVSDDALGETQGARLSGVGD
jgi:hypothetical protein